jgi:hypothetical protein
MEVWNVVTKSIDMEIGSVLEFQFIHVLEQISLKGKKYLQLVFRDKQTLIMWTLPQFRVVSANIKPEEIPTVCDTTVVVTRVTDGYTLEFLKK